MGKPQPSRPRWCSTPLPPHRCIGCRINRAAARVLVQQLAERNWNPHERARLAREAEMMVEGSE